MNKPAVKLMSGFVVLLTIFSVSYFLFSRYSPKVLRQLSDVKGAFTHTEPDLPYPRGSQKISESRTAGSRSIAFQTDKSPQEVQTFYRNVFVSDGWELDSEGTMGSFSKAKYKKDAQSILITSSDQTSNETIVTVEIGKR